MKILTLSLALVCLSGCSTVSNLVEKYTDVSCSKQIELTNEVMNSTNEGVLVAYQNEIIDRDKKNAFIDRLLIIMDDIDLASAQCTHSPATGKEMALKAVTAIETLEGEI